MCGGPGISQPCLRDVREPLKVGETGLRKKIGRRLEAELPGQNWFPTLWI